MAEREINQVELNNPYQLSYPDMDNFIGNDPVIDLPALQKTNRVKDKEEIANVRYGISKLSK